MEAALRKVISEFGDNPMNAARAMRALFEGNQAGFFEQSLPVLRREPASPGLNYLVTLLLTHGLLLRMLCDPEIFTLEEAQKIAGCLRQVDSAFDVRLVRNMVQNNGNTSAQDLDEIAGTATGIRLLDILSEISDGTRILSTMTQLLGHPNSYVRSKAALLVGRSNKNHKWVQERLGEKDPRVRANAVESLWGSDTPGSRAVFWTALGDDDNRVVGNAALGLYRLGDPATVGVILKLLSHQEAGFRVTGVWVMGETGDPRFIPILAAIISEPVVELRGNALRAMAKLKKAMSKRTASAALSVFVSVPRYVDNECVEFSAAIRCGRGQHMPDLNGTNFVIWEDDVLSREYSVRQRGRNEPIAIALAMPRIVDRMGGSQEIQETAVERALRYKRKCDAWMVLKYLTPEPPKSGPPPVPQLQPPKPTKYASAAGIAAAATAVMSPGDEDLSTVRMHFTNKAEEIADAVASPGTRMACASDLLQAMRALTEAAGQIRAARNIIFLCQSAADTFTPAVLEIAHATEAVGIAVHVVSSWPNQSMHELCSRTGGMLMVPRSPDEIPEALEAICASLLNSYEVRYQPENRGASKLRLQVYTDTLMGEGLQNLT